MTVVQFANRACRNLQVNDLRELSINDQQSVLDCINAGLRTVYHFLPVHQKQSREGATLAAPVAVTTATLPVATAGRSVFITGDIGLNRYRTDWSSALQLGADLMYSAPSTSGTLYSDVVRLSGQVKSVHSVSVPGSILRMGNWEPGRDEDLDVSAPTSYRIEPVSPADRATNEDQGIYTLRNVSMYLRVWPLPSASTRLSYTVEYGPAVIALADIMQNISDTTGVETPPPSLPLLEAYHADALAIVEEELSSLAIYAGDPAHAAKASARAQQRLSLEPNHPDAGKFSRRGTPEGW